MDNRRVSEGFHRRTFSWRCSWHASLRLFLPHCRCSGGHGVGLACYGQCQLHKTYKRKVPRYGLPHPVLSCQLRKRLEAFPEGLSHAPCDFERRSCPRVSLMPLWRGGNYARVRTRVPPCLLCDAILYAGLHIKPNRLHYVHSDFLKTRSYHAWCVHNTGVLSMQTQLSVRNRGTERNGRA